MPGRRSRQLPARRPLKIFALDPMFGRTAGNCIAIDVATEYLEPGPRGSRIEVIDYDSRNKCYYEPVNLNDPAILMQGGLEPTESDPRFHQQMVYAVAMKVIENFERALGRKITFKRNRRLRLIPHAFNGANAYYDRDFLGIMFGYFQADKLNPGPNLPGQNVFTCLSHDIIAHEMTHALVDRLRMNFLDPSNRDVWGFHEGFSDIVAIFQHFSFPDILRDQIQKTRTDLRSPTPMVNLAQQFGYATGKGQALRTALDRPDPKLYEKVMEPHERGSILVAAVFDAFFTTYQRRIRNLIRVASGGSGQMPDGDLHPDLVNLVADEAARTAHGILMMCIRAIEYLPPVDITYGDYLRALVTADYELFPQDTVGHRAALIEAFRLRGIYPDRALSLAEESLLWPRTEGLDSFPVSMLGELFLRDVKVDGIIRESIDSPVDWGAVTGPMTGNTAKAREALREELLSYAKTNADALSLDPSFEIQVRDFHFAFRIASDGQLLIEVVVQYEQEDPTHKDSLGGLPFRGGTTVIASAEGKVRYVIAKPLKSSQRSISTQRFEVQRDFAAECARNDPHFAWCEHDYATNHMALSKKAGFAAIHRRFQ